jgi:Fungal Zn(2)-Cys(6) binuclear cluster domain/Fungal specific transcription factor domain
MQDNASSAQGPNRVVIPRQSNARPTASQQASEVQPKLIRGPTQLLRRRHTKSRFGCIACKARRIKCGEEIPKCKNCLAKGISCRYKSDDSLASTKLFGPEAVSRLVQPSSANAIFTAREFGFFRHFLTAPLHPLPLGNDSVWRKEIPQLAHEHPFLMHAVLTQGASDFRLANPAVRVEYELLTLRGRAIAGLNKALDDVDAWNTVGFPDAVLATCYALCLQSSHVVDGLEDFGTFVQGSALVTERIRCSGLKTALNVTQGWPQHRIRPGLEHIERQMTDFTLIHQGLQALTDISSSLEITKESKFLQALRTTLSSFVRSPVQGYLESMLSYGHWYRLGEGLLVALRGTSSNPTTVVLIAAFLANMVLIKVLIPLQTWPPSMSNKLPFKTLQEMEQWVDAINASVPEHIQQYLSWPKSIFGLLPTSQIQQNASVRSFDAKVDILRNMELKAHMLLGDILRLGSELTSWFEDFVYSRSRQCASNRTPAAPERAAGAVDVYANFKDGHLPD